MGGRKRRRLVEKSEDRATAYLTSRQDETR
jgi:hypothetical protein